jgi:hypothetical protein
VYGLRLQFADAADRAAYRELYGDDLQTFLDGRATSWLWTHGARVVIHALYLGARFPPDLQAPLTSKCHVSKPAECAAALRTWESIVPGQVAAPATGGTQSTPSREGVMRFLRAPAGSWLARTPVDSRDAHAPVD